MLQSSSQHQPLIFDCYDELIIDPSLLQSFSEDEWMSLHGLSYLGALCFYIASEGLFTWLTSPVLWGKARADFITNAARRAMSTEIAPLAFLVTDWVGEGRLGIITTFCQSDQVQVEALGAFLTLVYWDSPKPGVVVVKVFTNSPYLPQGFFNSPYLDVTTLSAGALTGQFPLVPMCLCRLLHILPVRSSFHERKRGWARSLPIPHGGTVGELRRGASFVQPVPLSVPVIYSHSNRDMSTQTEGSTLLQPCLEAITTSYPGQG